MALARTVRGKLIDCTDARGSQCYEGLNQRGEDAHGAMNKAGNLSQSIPASEGINVRGTSRFRLKPLAILLGARLTSACTRARDQCLVGFFEYCARAG